MEILIIIMIVGLAAAYVIRTFYKKFQTGKASGCDCGCSSCDTGKTRCEPTIKN